MQYYPVFLKIAGRRCLVAGGGGIAFFKAKRLVEAAAHVTVVSPSFVPDFEKLAGIKRIQREFTAEDLEGARLAVSATGDSEMNRVFRDACRRRDVPYCITDDPDQCEFIVPAVLERGDLIMAISSGGAAPALVKRLRDELEDWLPPDLEAYLAFLRRARDQAGRRISDPLQRRRLAAHLASRESYEMFVSLGADQRLRWLDELLSQGDSIQDRS